MKKSNRKLSIVVLLFTLFFIYTNIEAKELVKPFIILENQNEIQIIANRNFKTGEFSLNKKIENEEIKFYLEVIEKDRINIEQKIETKKNKETGEIIKKETTNFKINNKKTIIKKGEIIFIVPKSENLKISLKESGFIVFIKIRKILEALLIAIYQIIGNFGLAIIILTILVKIILFPLTLKQDKSMRDMKKIQPEVDKLKEKYKDKPEELNKKTMALYKEFKVNPIGGCLPAILQLPILWTLFRVLRTDSINSVVPEGSRFLIWNLDSPDKWILPAANGIIAFIQQKFMSKSSTGTKNPMESMTMIFPVMMFVISMQMPAGLQIYWLTSSLISLLQQFIIMKKGEKDGK